MTRFAIQRLRYSEFESDLLFADDLAVSVFSIAASPKNCTLSSKFDLQLIVDTSGSVTQEGFRTMLRVNRFLAKWITTILHKFSFDPLYHIYFIAHNIAFFMLD